MPHKIYMCCDSNNCSCGRGEKLYGNNRPSLPSVEELAIGDLTDNQIEKYLEARKKHKIITRIKELEQELQNLRKQL